MNHGIVVANPARENVDVGKAKGVHDTHLFAKKTKTITKVENMDGHEAKRNQNTIPQGWVLEELALGITLKFTSMEH